MSESPSAAPDAGAPPSSLRINISLGAMMFLQYMLVAVWFVQLSAYTKKAGIDGTLATLILSSMAVGSMASPVVCGLAGRYLASEKVLAIANMATGVFLLGAALTGHNAVLTLVFTLLAMLFYMPTWALTSSIAMSHGDPKNFPRIRTLGTVGWVASGLFSIAAAHFFGVKVFDGTSLPFFCGAGIAIVAALQNLTLPSTPPSNDGSAFSISKALGLNAFGLLKDRDYLVFIAGSFAAMVAFVLYFSYAAQFLYTKGFGNITSTLNWGQAGEMVFMFLTTTVLKKIGVKKALLIGLLAMAARYFLFYLGDVHNAEPLYIAGILMHGLIFGWFFAGGQVYTDEKAPKELRAQAQGMFAFLIWGVGVLAGTFAHGMLIDKFTVAREIADPGSPAGVSVRHLTDWAPIFMGTSIFSLVIFAFFLVFFDNGKKAGGGDAIQA
ncbi:MAG: MFS transporter [Puniceicoccales bacterium]|jgi:nucleoside transporter|nr:MFS transporter [Puniceicoccales bacterium]